MLLRALVIVFSIPATVGGASAFDFDKAMDRLDNDYLACVLAIDHDGTKISDADVTAGCRNTISLMLELMANGYCYNEANDGWRECKVSND